MVRRTAALGVLSGVLVGPLGALMGRSLGLTLACCALVAVGFVLLLTDEARQRG